MRITLRETDRSEALVFLETALPPFSQPQSLLYRTRVGALATLDGVTAGAFDREHDAIELPASTRERTLRLAVEREGLPTNGLPPGDDIRWRWMLFRAHPEPQRYVDVCPSATPTDRARVDGDGITLWGHSHLDVAWLWTYAQSARKAVRTFANALALLDDDPSFIFMQSQPQLYAFVSREDPELFARVLAEVARGRFDADVAAMWVEPDCNVPSGESLLRQLLFAHAYCAREFGVEPSIAWLPDTFGFARTLPTLLAHAGIKYFATTKLQWNDTTRFPYPQFRWRGPDGSEITSALIASYDGGPDAGRLAVARERGEPMVVGYGDGGGGPTRRHLEQAETIGTWQRPREWFEALDARRETLPVHDDELYLEYHRGAFTTHHDIKSFNAALERALVEAEEQLAWCTAVRAPAATLERLRASLA
ncbi:MAG TPA: alpha-mannosidase, partial [Candidatus Baltobacteraceae bacterium]|nr:alpha-mannosidase [Candidatus Baltobacteraceae bacterium]